MFCGVRLRHVTFAKERAGLSIRRVPYGAGGRAQLRRYGSERPADAVRTGYEEFSPARQNRGLQV